MQNWLQDKTSMTAKLREHDPALRIEILQEGFENPTLSEAQALSLAVSKRVFVREVLMVSAEPWLFARSVFHPDIENGPFKEFFHFGSRPLGEVLFSQPEIKRIKMEVVESPEHYPSRTSLFLILDLPMYMTEIFLPNCPLVIPS